MMGLIDSIKNGEARFSVGHFDLIIIDEAHRSVYQKYGAIFKYFDSLLVGLTATPREEIDRNTYDLFDLEQGVPTDAYELEKAVSDSFLTPPTANIVEMRFPRSGIKYEDLTEEEKEQWESVDWGDNTGEVGMPREVNASAVNRWLFNTDTADKMLKELMDQGHKVDGGDKLGKTIIFARNHKHAVFIEERFNHHYPDKKGSFARIIDHYAQYAQSLIDDFSIADKDPQIAISVDMLDTDIDVPEICNLVFFKPVYSKIKFLQMIGRGTRLCPNLFGNGRHKEDFRVFDFCGNFDFFEEQPEGIEANGGGGSLATRIFRDRVAILDALQNTRVAGSQTTFQTIKDRLRDEVMSMHLDNFQVRMQRELIEPMQVASFWKDETLPEQNIANLREEIALLPNTLPSDEIEARFFDTTLLGMQLAEVSGDPSKFNNGKIKLLDIARKLEEKNNIPVVKLQLAFIQAIQEVSYWDDITLDMLEEIRIKLRSLIHLIEKGFQPEVYTDFEDEILERRQNQVFEAPAMTGVQYEKKVLAALNESLDRFEIQKLREGKALTNQDLEELEKMLVTLGEKNGKELLDQLLARKQAPSLALFIRSCVGMDRKSAHASFAEFLDEDHFTTTQIRFIELIISHLTANGVISTRALYESPFISINVGGPDAIFTDNTVLDRIIGTIEKLNQVAG
jgi:type I restriction enzyme R subunit